MNEHFSRDENRKFSDYCRINDRNCEEQKEKKILQMKRKRKMKHEVEKKRKDVTEITLVTMSKNEM